MRLVWSINRAFALVNKRTILPKRCTSSYFCISEKKLQTNTNLLNKLQIQTNIDVKNPKFYCTSQELVDALKFEEVCEETLESLCEYFDTLIENNPDLKGSDVVYGVSFNKKSMVYFIVASSIYLFSGWCINCFIWIAFRNICYKSSNSKSSNLVKLSNVWT